MAYIQGHEDAATFLVNPVASEFPPALATQCKFDSGLNDTGRTPFGKSRHATRDR